MIYLKSILAGVCALVLSVVLLPIGFIIYNFGVLLFGRSHGTGRGEVGWDLRSMFANSVIPWMIVLAIFGLGFYWEFRRASR
jgi:hypothetical protein